jgi:hypothetical protein
MATIRVSANTGPRADTSVPPSNKNAVVVPRSMYFAAGARGQFCFVLPEHDMVIATMGYGATQLSAPDAWKALSPVLPSI